MVNFFNKDFEEIYISEIVSVLGGLFAGTILAFLTNQFYLIPGLLIFIPGFLELRGSINGSLASRLSSGLFIGAINIKKPSKNIINSNVIACVLLSLIVSFILGVLAYVFTLFVFDISAPKIIFVALASAFIANIIDLPLTMGITFYLFHKGYDPNNIMGPVVTTIGDITSVLSILIALFIL